MDQSTCAACRSKICSLQRVVESEELAVTTSQLLGTLTTPNACQMDHPTEEDKPPT